MRIAIGCDHRGLKPKALLARLLTESGHTVNDLGTYSEDSVDYPDIAETVGKAVVRGEADKGILICDTGIGMSIAANKVKGVRAALCSDAFCAARARQHNDANVMCISGRLEEAPVREILSAFLGSTFEGGRHQRRVDKISALEK